VSEQCLVIAEAGVNHNGSLPRALGLVDAAAGVGADVVKFQSFTASSVASITAPKAAYQEGILESQVEMLRSLELSHDDQIALAERASQRGIKFMSTAFDLASVRFLSTVMGITRAKIPSGEVTNGPYLLEVAQGAENVILSTGMCTIEEIRSALAVIAFGLTSAIGTQPSRAELERTAEMGFAAFADRITLLHCTSAYPTPIDEANLAAMDTIRDTFSLPVGYSDHTPGIAVAIAAVARGAVVIEKHLTLDRSMPGPDHAASIEPDQFAALVQGIRDVEQAIGSQEKIPTPSEIANMYAVRRGLVAAKPILNGEMFTDENITAKRPAAGLDPMRYWDLMGTIATMNYAEDDPIAG
jgi:N-acetylneuraminate synthase